MYNYILASNGVTSLSLHSKFVGDDCELDRNGCLMEPCPDQTKCQDLDAATERATGLSFKCTDCPKGYKLVNNDTKCEGQCLCSRNLCIKNNILLVLETISVINLIQAAYL